MGALGAHEEPARASSKESRCFQGASGAALTSSPQGPIWFWLKRRVGAVSSGAFAMAQGLRRVNAHVESDASSRQAGPEIPPEFCFLFPKLSANVCPGVWPRVSARVFMY